MSGDGKTLLKREEGGPAGAWPELEALLEHLEAEAARVEGRSSRPPEELQAEVEACLRLWQRCG